MRRISSSEIFPARGTSATLERHPEVGAALVPLAGKISEEEMRRMNYEVDGGHRDPADVVREFRNAKHL